MGGASNWRTTCTECPHWQAKFHGCNPSSDLALGVLLECAHLRFDGIGMRHSLGEAGHPNSLLGLAAARILAEVKAAFGGAVSAVVWLGVNLTGIFRAPNLIFASRWQYRAGSTDDDEGGGCDYLHFVLMLFVVEINFFYDMSSTAMKVGSESTEKLTVIDFDRMAF
jgi:hypothetical protein